MVGGGDDGFREWVLACQHRLLHFADLLTGDRGRAEDLVQHALYKTYQVWRHDRVQRPEAYARRVIVNGHNDWWRRLSSREQPRDRMPDHSGTDDPAADWERRAAVLAALARLTRRERVVVVMRYYADLTEADTARELGVPVGTVKSTAAGVMTKLRSDPHLSAEVTS